MKTRLLLLITALMVFAAALTGCTDTVKSDPATEEKLVGSWECSETEYEDGIAVTTTSRETYSLDDHRFEAKLTLRFGYPINARIATVTYSGKWRASKEVLVCDIDKNSIKFSGNMNILDRSDLKELRQEMESELKKNDYREAIEFISLINSDSFTAKDDDGEIYKYRRID